MPRRPPPPHRPVPRSRSGHDIPAALAREATNRARAKRPLTSTGVQLRHEEPMGMRSWKCRITAAGRVQGSVNARRQQFQPTSASMNDPDKWGCEMKKGLGEQTNDGDNRAAGRVASGNPGPSPTNSTTTARGPVTAHLSPAIGSPRPSAMMCQGITNATVAVTAATKKRATRRRGPCRTRTSSLLVRGPESHRLLALLPRRRGRAESVLSSEGDVVRAGATARAVARYNSCVVRIARSSGYRLLWRCGWSPRWGAKCIESPAALSNPE